MAKSRKSSPTPEFSGFQEFDRIDAAKELESQVMALMSRWPERHHGEFAASLKSIANRLCEKFGVTVETIRFVFPTPAPGLPGSPTSRD